MNHILPKALKERHFISYSVLTVSYYLMLGHTSGVPVANEVYAFLLVNEEICINCHHLYQSLQRLPALNPNQTSYRETYWSLRLLHFCAFALLHFCTLVLCESISYSPLHLADLSRPIWKLHIIHLINRSIFHLFIIKD